MRGRLLAQSIVLAFVVAWPMPWLFATRTLGHPNGDGPKHVWTVWWTRRELLDGTAGLTTHLVNFPDGARLWPVEPLNGLLAALLPLPPMQAANVLTLVHLVLLGLCAGWLGWLTTRRADGALATAALFQGGAWTAFTLQVGVGELRQAWWLPLGFAVLLRAKEARKPGWFVLLGLTLAAATASCFYYGFLLGVGFAVFALFSRDADRALMKGYGITVAVATLLALPVVLGFGSTWDAPVQPLLEDGAVTRDFAIEALRPHELVTPRFLDRATTPAFERAYLGGRYLGIVVLLMAAVSLWRAPRPARAWVAVGGMGVLLAMGTVLLGPSGEPVRIAGVPVLLPLGMVYDLLGTVAVPPNFPARFLALSCLAVAVLAPLAIQGRVVFPLVAAALLDVSLGGLSGWPRQMFAMPDMRGLAAAASEGAVADFTLVASGDLETRVLSMAAQIELDRPMQGLPIERLDKWSSSGAQWMFGLQLARDVVYLQSQTVAEVPPERDYSADLWLLRERGFDRILLSHRGSGPDARSVQHLVRVLGEPLAVASRGMIWAIPEVDRSLAKPDAWRTAHAKRSYEPLMKPGNGP